MKLYDYLPSGNGYKVRLLLSWLGEDYDFVALNIHAGDTKTPDFLAKNPAGQIPLLELDDGRVLAESNAIMFYLALGSDYLPTDAFAQGEVLRWMFFEQYKHEPSIAVARFIHNYAYEDRKRELPALMKKGKAALDVMEGHLNNYDFFVGDKLSIADIALYAYTHVGEEGKFDLKSYKAIRAWLNRVKKHPNYIKITDIPK
ncbi:MAG: glutathione S-transferase family protein [Acidimicrobiales bacterium]|nr:glutathione S-transferase family protein [Hyphomonadaceae bacterium]RZV44129.1 MAG: glutathione S-transferase family protein [Acidimicrobiales bacterium]